MKLAGAVLLLLLAVVAGTPASASTSLLPVFTGYLIENEDPLVSRAVTITAFIDVHDTLGNDQSGYYTITLYLFWSRDRASWISVTMSVLDTETYQGVIPAQDGSDNRFYDAGAGTCYWFIRMKNNLGEEDTLFTAQQPDDEITFHDPQAVTKATSGTTAPVQPFSFDSIIDSVTSITNDPAALTTLVLIAGIIIFLLAVRGRGFQFLRVLFRR